MQNEFDYRKYLNLILAHKRLFAVTALAIMTAAVVASYLIPKKFEASSKVFIERNVITELVRGIAITPSMEQVTMGLKEAISSRTLVQKVIKELDLDTAARSDGALEDLTREIQKNTTVNLSQDNILTVSYIDGNPRVARDFVNTLVRRYIEMNVSSKREDSYGAIQFLSEQIETFKGKMSEAENQLNKYKSDKGGVITVNETELFTQIGREEQSLNEIQMRRRHLEKLRPITRMAADPLQTQLSALNKRLDELRVSYTESYPEIVRIKGEVETVRHQLKGRTYRGDSTGDSQELQRNDAEIQALRESEASLARHIAENRALLKSVPAAKAGLEKLELDKNNARALYEQLQARHGQSEVSKQMEVQDKTTTFRIIDSAVMPVAPISPNRVRIILMGIAAGLAGGLGLLLAMDYLNKSVKSIDSLKSLGVRVLAVIPKIRDPKVMENERRMDVRLYMAAGAYFFLILLVLVLEMVKLSPVDGIVAAVKAAAGA